MDLFLDTEFNGFGGQLISMALVSETGDEWYEVLECKKPKAWVKKNVMPRLQQAPIDYGSFQISLQKFLREFTELNIIVDWPDDIKYFCEVLIDGPGHMLNLHTIKFELNRDLNSLTSKIPHNALEDARAIRTEYMGY